MLRPERMSKVSVAGSRQVMRDVIEATFDLHLVHFSEYEGQIEGFDTGSPIEGSEEASDKLVTVRSLKSILDVSEEDAGPARIVSEEALEEKLEDVRITVNEREDRRSNVEGQLNSVTDQIEAAAPFSDLGMDIDLLKGYDTLEVAVGEGDEEAVRSALSGAEDVEAFELYTGEDTVAAFVYPESGSDGVLEDALVGIEFNRVEVPDASGDPDDYVAELRHEKQKLESKLERIEAELRDLQLEYGGFLLAAEERLNIEVKKKEVPLRFATTEHAFVAEGWIPAGEYERFEETIVTAADDSVDVDQLEVASYREYAHEDGHEEETTVAEAEPGAEPVTDGGAAEFQEDDSPPVVLDNPASVRPFELLVRAINQPKYWEFDPSVILLLTFPVFFGFMIGDVGYGILYAGIGYLLLTRVDSDGIQSLGGIAVWSGLFTILFGILFGEFFGLHFLGDVIWGGHPPMHKGLQPQYLAYAQGWLFLTLFIALGHLTLGYALGFLNLLPHGFKEAAFEKGSWMVLMLGVWLWIFSQHAAAAKPDLLFAVFNAPGATLPSGGTVAAEQVAYSLGFSGFSASIGLVGLAAAAVGLAMLLFGEGTIGLLESLNVLVNVLSYARIAAVLLAKAGMAFVVNLLFFGAYQTPDGAFHFYGIGAVHTLEHGTEMFPGLVHMGAAGWLGGILVFVLGHLLVLALGITSAGLQAVRLEYVEFFGKFYEGGGDKYEPFGYKRRYTTED